VKVECSDLSRKIMEGRADTDRSADDKDKLQSEVIRLQREVSMLRMSPSKELELVKRDLMSALSEKDALSFSMRTLEASYAELKQAKTALDRKIDALEGENQNLKLRLSRGVAVSPRGSVSTRELVSRVSPFAKDKPADEENGSEADAGWDDNFFSNLFKGKDDDAPEGDGDEAWDDSYFMDLLGIFLGRHLVEMFFTCSYSSHSSVFAHDSPCNSLSFLAYVPTLAL